MARRLPTHPPEPPCICQVCHQSHPSPEALHWHHLFQHPLRHYLLWRWIESVSTPLPGETVSLDWLSLRATVALGQSSRQIHTAPASP